MRQPLPEAMPPGRSKRRGWIVAGAVLVLSAAALLLSWHAALHQLRQQVLAALGPEASLRALRIAWPGIVVVDDLQLAAPQGWPTQQTLRAGRVEVVPALRSLATERVIVDAVIVDGAYLSVRRTRAGKLELLPTLIGHAGSRTADAAGTRPRQPVTLERIVIKDAIVDFHDASVRGAGDRPVRLQLSAVDARLEDLRLPDLDGRSALELRGRVRGADRADGAAAGRDRPPDRDAAAQRDGSFSVKGWVQVASRESDLDIRIDNVDLVALEPYLIKRSETGVRRGRLSMNLKSRVRGRRLHAPGRLVLDDLRLASGGGLRATFMGMPRDAVVAALKRGGDRIELDFTLDGELDQARFSLNETLATRVAVGMAQSLGIGLIDIVKDVGTFGGNALDATGDALGKLFGADGGTDVSQP